MRLFNQDRKEYYILDLNNNPVYVGDTVSYIVKIKGGDELRTSSVYKITNKGVEVDKYDCHGYQEHGKTQYSSFPRFVKIVEREI